MLEFSQNEVRCMITTCRTVRAIRVRGLRKDKKLKWTPEKGKRNSNQVAIDRLDNLLEKLILELDELIAQFDITEHA